MKLRAFDSLTVRVIAFSSFWAIAAFSVLAYSLVLTLVIGFAIEKTLGFRVKSEDEIAGVDLAEHGEEGYVLEEKLA